MKNSDDLCFLPAWRLSEMRATGEISCAEITGAYLSRIAKLDSKLNSYVEVFTEEASAAAAALDGARDGRNRS
ncbi:Asp-tRNA(Asn)/Glu-tRNA(Gln) amidotransferase GatCAB subunit A, partial [Mesorhizobium sp. M7A.F.Ca.US.006.01.1.1]